jgi:hypothetical protein
VREFDELTKDLPEEERERLRRVHDQLLEAGPLPELPRSLRHAPRPAARAFVPGRRVLAGAVAAALLAAGSFAVGYVVADDGGEFGHDFYVVIEVRGLPALPSGGRYLLYLTRNGRPVAWCGSFRVHEGKTTAPLNAPYRFDRSDGWVVRADIPGRVDTRPYLVSDEI